MGEQPDDDDASAHADEGGQVSVTYVWTLDTRSRVGKRIAHRQAKGWGDDLKIWAAAIPLSFVLSTAAAVGLFPGAELWKYAAVAIFHFLTFIVVQVMSVRLRRRISGAVSNDPRNVAEITIVIDRSGVQMATDFSSQFYTWFGIESVAVEDQIIYFDFSKIGAFVVPFGAFADEQSRESFIDRANDFYRNRRNREELSVN